MVIRLGSPEQKAKKREYDRAYRQANLEKKREQDRKYAEEHKEQIKVYSRSYCASHRQEAKEAAKLWYQSNPERAKVSRKLYREMHRDESQARDRAYAAALRAKVVLGYGGHCVCCGQAEPRFLAVSQSCAQGTAKRKEIGAGPVFYNWLIRNDFPSVFLLLCLNCNRGKHRNLGVCPHGERLRQVSEDTALVIAEYGGRCACCGETEPLFMEIDHVYSDGFRHRAEHPGASSMAQWLRRNGFPKTDFRLLCSNCNVGRSLNQGVCPHTEILPSP